MQLTLVLPWWARLLRRARTTASTPPAETARAGRRLRALRPVGDRGDGEPGPTLADLYQARRLDMIRVAAFLVDDLHTAEDVVQDAFAAVCRRHGSRLDSLQDAHAYLYTAVVNAARSVLRRRRTARAYTPPYQGPGAPVDEPLLLAEEHRQVLDALARLAPRQREVLVLRYWSELTEAQIAETLGVSRGSVKSTASRALVTLEKLLEAAR
ncbi:sigma-70 family RNA polymerase sigma factor [Streptomyces coffeae]|uniref:Sigma-70 family RNA polymerase sigma factor n=1 Tax=Streptomyces coffeae TaxID=621382 RepID=A0ABS1NE18_9ACTN|nr:sigma-70 family RNA polymerase sigma factor [Streptomyces coffeae]MBL1098051.1 sigma-70 family RNA polymerase sigma factor [Streptomyces coffeae]